MGRVTSVKCPQSRYDLIALSGREFRINRDAEHFARELVRHLAATERCGWEVCETLLLIEGDRVINFAADLAGEQMVLESIAATVQHAEGELVPDVVVPFTR